MKPCLAILLTCSLFLGCKKDDGGLIDIRGTWILTKVHFTETNAAGVVTQDYVYPTTGQPNILILTDDHYTIRHVRTWSAAAEGTYIRNGRKVTVTIPDLSFPKSYDKFITDLTPARLTWYTDYVWQDGGRTHEVAYYVR